MFNLGFIKLLGEGMGLARALLDPDKKEKAFHLAMRKNARAALNIAEDIFDLVDEQLPNLPSKFSKKYKRLKKRFNNLD